MILGDLSKGPRRSNLRPKRLGKCCQQPGLNCPIGLLPAKVDTDCSSHGQMLCGQEEGHETPGRTLCSEHARRLGASRTTSLGALSSRRPLNSVWQRTASSFGPV